MAIKYKNTKDISHKEWLEIRQLGIGGSDAAAIAGLNPWKSPLSVYLDKTSEIPQEIPDNERMRVGRDLEDYVAKRFEEATGKKVRKNNFMLVSEDHQFMMANLDREIVGENAFLECKTTNSYSKAEWEKGIPPHYEIQVLHYMAVTGAEKAYIACLIGNEKFIYHEVKRDEEAINYLIEIEKKFWEDTKKGILPEPDGSSDYDEALKQKYSATIDDEIPLNISDEVFTELYRYKDLKKEAETKIKILEQKIKLSLGEYEAGVTDKYKATWKTQSRSSIDTKKFKEDYPELSDKYTKINETRVLRIKEVN